MQQFTVPQFIDVEPTIIGPITTRQFLILLTDAVITGLSYKMFDFTLFVVIGVVSFLLAILIAFIKINGRPFHLFLLNLVQTFRRSAIRIWGNNNEMEVKPEKLVVVATYQAVPPRVYKSSRLAELALIVDTEGKYKGE